MNWPTSSKFPSALVQSTEEAISSEPASSSTIGQHFVVDIQPQLLGLDTTSTEISVIEKIFKLADKNAQQEEVMFRQDLVQQLE
jgi:hypothetical protein